MRTQAMRLRQLSGGNISGNTLVRRGEDAHDPESAWTSVDSALAKKLA